MQFLIIVPSYNQAEYLNQTLASILKQKVSLRVMVFDGGSTDGTRTVLERYQDKYPQQLTWVSQSDGGQPDAINKGFKKILGQNHDPDQTIVAYLNSDDLYLPNALKTVADAFLHNPQKQWLVGDAVIIDAQNKETQFVIRLYKRFFRQLQQIPGFFSLVLSILNPLPQPAVFWRLNALKEVGFLNQTLHFCLDYEYWWRLWQKTNEPLFVNQALAAFRIHEKAKGSRSFELQFSEEVAVAKKYTKLPLLLSLHKLHALLITFFYRFLK